MSEFASRIQLALNVDDLESAIAFYQRLFGSAPAKRRSGYANFAIEQPPLKLVLIENPGGGQTLNHLGIEVSTVNAVSAYHARLTEAGAALSDAHETTCCYAAQEKFWVEGSPQGHDWEVYTVLADSLTFAAGSRPECCGSGAADAAGHEEPAASCC